MDQVQLLFSRTNSIESYAVRMMSWSRWSHVALVHGDAIVEAVPGVGVRRTSFVEAIRDVSDARIVSLPGIDEERIFELMCSQIGKPYDWGAVFGIALHRDWQNDEKWFCSELIAWAFAKAGDPLFREEVIHRITPEHLWMVTK